MEITGRVTADAVVRRAGEKEVLSFSIAVNERYQLTGSEEYKQVTTFINCSYWLTMKAGQWLKKGAVVLLNGRLGMHVYINGEGNPIGSIDFHVNKITFVAFAKRTEDTDNTGKATDKVQEGNSSTVVKNGKAKGTEEVPF